MLSPARGRGCGAAQGSPKEGTTALEVLLPSREENQWVSEHLRLLKCSAGYMVFAVDCKLLRTDSLPLLLFYFIIIFF